ncbi:MAG TPA: glucokinase [Rickettsiales bacterium]|nr:glucokinase [Rickettsiales bacterium]
MTNKQISFVGDVGGTNARFALVEDGKLVSESIYNCINSDYGSTVDALKAFLREQGNPKVDSACLALACPITGDTVKLTNCDWEFSQKAIKDALGLRRVVFVNDFTALAMGVPELTPEQYFAVGGGSPKEHMPIGVMGAGTGFGVSALIWGGEQWTALQGEGGHIGFAPVNEVEAEIMRLGWKEYGERVSVERILSGAGIEFLYRSLSHIKGEKPRALKASDITIEAIEDPQSTCGEVVKLFLGVLGTVAGDWALQLGAMGGIYIGGGIVPKLGDLVHKSRLRGRFEAKGRFKDYVSEIPLYVITDSVQTALVGAATILNNRK